MGTSCANCYGLLGWPEYRDVYWMVQHHVVYAQTVRKHGGDIWAPENSMTVCQTCHQRQHEPFHQARRIPLRALTDANYEFARELLGAYAYDYLRARYSGSDPRLDAILEEK